MIISSGAFRIDGSAVSLHDAFSDSKSEARALAAIGARRCRCTELPTWMKSLRAFLGKVGRAIDELVAARALREVPRMAVARNGTRDQSFSDEQCGQETSGTQVVPPKGRWDFFEQNPSNSDAL